METLRGVIFSYEFIFIRTKMHEISLKIRKITGTRGGLCLIKRFENPAGSGNCRSVIKTQLDYNFKQNRKKSNLRNGKMYLESSQCLQVL